MKGSLLRFVFLLVAGTGILFGFRVAAKRSFSPEFPNQTVRHLTAQLEETRRSSESQIQQLSQTHVQLAEELERTRKELQRLQAELAVDETNPAQAKPVDLLRVLKKKEIEIAALAKQITQKEESATRSQKELQAVRQALKGEQERSKKLARQAQEAGHIKGALTQRLKSQEAQARREEASRKKWEEEFRRLRVLLQESERKLAQERQEHERRQGQLQKSLAVVETAQEKLEAQLQKDRAFRTENERLRREIAEANDRIAELLVTLDQQEKLTAQLVESSPQEKP